ncbi:MAG: class I SAM-dependent methyltransferase [Acidobacteriota bacterium]|nr:class I SAM-dependent methyltransferase [Acidobacteriota bacterium]
MSDTLGDWLKLREAADWEARSSRLVQQVVDAIVADQPLQVLDLATGTGSNVRYLAERLPGHQRWLVVDRSPDLLALVTDRTASWAAVRGYECHAHATGLHVRHQTLDCEIETRQRDLRVLDDDGLFEGRHLVTASALLDLVSESWLRSLAAHCRDAGAAVLFALTYNGESSCSPEEPEDELIRELLNRHQHTDKGLGGVAAGPDAVACAERCFIEVGYQVRIEPTHWNIGPAHADMQRYLITDWARAAMELALMRQPQEGVASTGSSWITSWRDRRLAHIDAGRSRIIVRHRDLAAWPAKP